MAVIALAPKRHHDDAPDAIKKTKLEVVINLHDHYKLLLIN